MWQEENHPRDDDGKFSEKGGEKLSQEDRISLYRRLGKEIPISVGEKQENGIAEGRGEKQISAKDIKNKKDFVTFIEQQLGVTLKNDAGDSFNQKRNVLYTEIPRDKKTNVLSFLEKHGFFVEEHLNNKYWIGIKARSGA